LERYLAHLGSNAKVVPLDEVDDFLSATRIDVATNIHSFSECRLEAIEWWVTRLARAGVRYIMVVPNLVDPGDGHCLTNAHEDMEEVFAEAGYVATVREPRHRDPQVQRYGVDPTWLNLFELTTEC
jgi:hypothetical protein